MKIYITNYKCLKLFFFFLVFKMFVVFFFVSHIPWKLNILCPSRNHAFTIHQLLLVRLNHLNYIPLNLSVILGTLKRTLRISYQIQLFTLLPVPKNHQDYFLKENTKDLAYLGLLNVQVVVCTM